MYAQCCSSCSCCSSFAPPLHCHLFAPDLVSSLSTPMAQCRQQLIQGRGLFHVHNDADQENDAAKLATSRTSYTDHLLAPDSTSCLPTPRALHREQLIQGRGLFHVHNLRSRKMSLPNDSETNNELNFVLLYSHLLTHCLHKAWHLAFVLVWELLLG